MLAHRRCCRSFAQHFSNGIAVPSRDRWLFRHAHERYYWRRNQQRDMYFVGPSDQIVSVQHSLYQLSAQTTWLVSGKQTRLER